MHVLINLWLRGITSLPIHLMCRHLICPGNDISCHILNKNNLTTAILCQYVNMAIDSSLFHLLTILELRRNHNCAYNLHKKALFPTDISLRDFSLSVFHLLYRLV